MAFDFFSHGRNDRLAVRTLTDFGIVHRGTLLTQRQEASLAIDQQGDMLFIRISVLTRHGDRPSTSRVVSWPYSRGDASVLCPVLNDLAVLQDERISKAYTPPRSVAARFGDRLRRRDSLGTYQLISVIDQVQPIGIEADIAMVGGETLVTLTQQQRGSRVARIWLPPMAFAPMSRKLRELMMTTNPAATTRRIDYEADARKSGQPMQDLPVLEIPEGSPASIRESRSPF